LALCRHISLCISQAVAVDAVWSVSYQPSSAITTSSDLTAGEDAVVPARSAPTSAMDPDDPIPYPRRRSAAIAWNVASSSTVISQSISSGW
jgi:hypothetical protein